MPSRPEIPGPPMNREELKRFKRSIALLAPAIVEREFHDTLEQVKLRPLPHPRVMQELVALWRQLWAWRRR